MLYCKPTFGKLTPYFFPQYFNYMSGVDMSSHTCIHLKNISKHLCYFRRIWFPTAMTSCPMRRRPQGCLRRISAIQRRPHRAISEPQSRVSSDSSSESTQSGEEENHAAAEQEFRLRVSAFALEVSVMMADSSVSIIYYITL